MLHPKGLMAEVLGRGAAVFTTRYETSLLCSSDSVTHPGMKVMPLHINVLEEYFHDALTFIRLCLLL